MYSSFFRKTAIEAISFAEKPLDKMKRKNFTMTENNTVQIGSFSAADILLPPEENLQRWAVIACDQFTSQPEYWKSVETECRNVPSAYHLILPESDLEGDCSERIEQIHRTMLRYLHEKIFREYPDCFVYTERTLTSGMIRKGLIGKADLEQYDYSDSANAEIMATEKTVKERIPPRMAVRYNAALELPHILLLCNDERCRIIEPIHESLENLIKLYDFNLMLGGGHVAGWLVCGEEKQKVLVKLREYETYEKSRHPDRKLIYAVGDGNHSLATAKACFERYKADHPEIDFTNHPARYALCELNNIHDPSQIFEPIHRLVKHCDASQLISDCQKYFDSVEGAEVLWYCGDKTGSVRIPERKGMLALSALQDWLDSWIGSNQGEIDYIHGEDALRMLGRKSDSVAFLLPPIQKANLFNTIMTDGVLPRKTFSMGEAKDKRYYLEARRVLPSEQGI